MVFSFNEFKPTIFFLIKFLGLYLAVNFMYGWYVISWQPKPDPVTSLVSNQSAFFLNSMGYDAYSVDSNSGPTTLIFNSKDPILSVYEGCNGINSAIVFISFILAFGPITKKMIWFIPMGLIIIHVSNLFRIILLFLVSVYLPRYIYFTHKYLFTASIYFIIFLMWVLWVARYSNMPNERQRP